MRWNPLETKERARERPGKGFLIPYAHHEEVGVHALGWTAREGQRAHHSKICLAKFALTMFESSNLCHV